MDEQQDLYGGKELQSAVLNGDINRIKKLYQQYSDRLDVNYYDRMYCNNPLISLTYCEQIAHLLIEYGADINKIYCDDTDTKLTPLAFACLNGRNLGVMKILLDNGADPNLGQKSALMIAVQMDDYDRAELLLQYGADPTYVMPIGFSTIEHVNKRGYSQRMIDLINGCTMTKSANKHYKK